MKMTLSKSKNAEQVYITKSYRNENGKSTSKIYKKLGTMADLLPEHDNDRDKVIAWAKEQAKLYTEAEKSGTLKISVDFSENKQLKIGERTEFNAGYLFLQKIYYDLKLDEICRQISDRHDFRYDLNEVLKALLFARILAPSSKLSTYDYVQCFLERPNLELQHIYRALDVLCQESDFIQASLYENSKCVQKRNTSILYYDCTNFFFEIEEEKGIRQYGRSKEHRPNPIVQMGLFLDGDGIPLAFTMFDGNQNEQPTLIPLEKKIIKDFQLSQFIVCTDAGLAARSNRVFNNIQNRSYVVTQSLKTLKEHLQEWALDPAGWNLDGSRKTYDLSKINEDQYMDRVFYKERWINENGLEQRLIVTFSPKYKRYQRYIRERQVNRAEKIVKKGKSAKRRNPNSPERYVESLHTTKDGEVAEQMTFSVKEEQIKKDEAFDGFYAVCTTLEDDPSAILRINRRRWEIEESFRIMKSELKARPVHLRRDERIKAHFLTCFLALMIYRLLEKQLNEEFTVREILETLRGMNLHDIKGMGYTPAFTRSRITDALHENAGFHLDRELITKKSLKKIIKATKN